jgi:hypothetical protein
VITARCSSVVTGQEHLERALVPGAQTVQQDLVVVHHVVTLQRIRPTGHGSL